MLEDLATLESRVGRVYKNRMETYCGDSFKQPRTSEKKKCHKNSYRGSNSGVFLGEFL